MNLEELGISKAELVNRLVERIVGDLDDEGRVANSLHTALANRIRDAVMKAVGKSTQTKIDKAVSGIIAQPWPRTNQYGEPKGEPLTFREMVVDKLEEYLAETVDPRDGSKPDYNREKCPRIDWLIRSQVAASIKGTVDAAAAEAATKARAEVLGKMDAAVIQAVRNVMGIK